MACPTAAFFAIFYQNMSKFGSWVVGWVLVINPSVLKIFLKFPNSLRSSVLSDLATREAFSGDNNLVPFHLW